jgi:glycosyltransferase involved in cell wall biosynthesis
MNKLSVVIITFNEEENIARCLDSVKEIADEIVVVDSFSTDKTEDICKEYKTVFYKKKFEGHIQQKNDAASKATFDYVLSLDADEVLSPKLQKAILKEKENFKFDGYFLNRMTIYLGHKIRHGAWYPDRKLRLWNRKKGSWGGQNPHDKFEMISEASTTRLPGDILHYSYFSIEQHVQQFDKFTSISAAELFKEGKKAGYFKIFGSAFFNFFKGFFIKLAFLDGFYGIVICIFNSFATFIKYIKLRELNKKN